MQMRAGATCAIAGPALLFVGSYLHPMGADPNEPVAAFTEYAADHFWVASHLTQLAGVAAMVAAVLFLTEQLEARRRSYVARIAAGGAIASLALAAALQAVDGIALKTMVDAWAAAPTAQKEVAFHAAFAVRQVEIGLASIVSLLFGLTVTLYGIALLIDDTYPKWIGGLAVVGGVPITVAGVVMAYTGFSGLAIAISMAAGSLLLVWMLTLGVLMWRRGGVRTDDTSACSIQRCSKEAIIAEGAFNGKPVEVEILTDTYKMRGTLFIPLVGDASRLSNFLNNSEKQFLAITHAHVEALPDAEMKWETRFLAVNKSVVTMVRAIEE